MQVPKEALKAASARLAGSKSSKWAEPTTSRARTTTDASSSEESSFVYPGNDLAANIEKADGFYDSTWKPWAAGDNATATKDHDRGSSHTNAIPISANHNRTSSWITMISDGNTAQTAANVSAAYLPTPSYHTLSPSSAPQALPDRPATPNSAFQPVPPTQAEDPWAAWTSSDTKVTGEDAYRSRKSISAGKGALPSAFGPSLAKTGVQASIHAEGAATSGGRGSAGRGRGRGKAEVLSIKGSSAGRAKSPVQSTHGSLPTPSGPTTSPIPPPTIDPSAAQQAAATGDADPWAAWSPASNAVTGQVARKARELATKAGKAVVESNIVKPLPKPFSAQAKPPAPPAPISDNRDLVHETARMSDAQDQGQDEVPARKVVSGWTTIDVDAPSACLASPSRQSFLPSIARAEAVQVDDEFSHLTLNSKETMTAQLESMSKNESDKQDLGLLVALGETETHHPISHVSTDRQKLQDSPTSSFASFHTIEDDGMANIPILKPSSSQTAVTGNQQNGQSTSRAEGKTVTIPHDRQILETKLQDLGYTGTDISAIAGLLCSLPKSNLKKCLADDTFLKRKAEEAMRILQADDEEEEEL